MQNNKSLGIKGIIIPFSLVTILFFMWGLANNMTDTLLAAFKKIMIVTTLYQSGIKS